MYERQNRFAEVVFQDDGKCVVTERYDDVAQSSVVLSKDFFCKTLLLLL